MATVSHVLESLARPRPASQSWPWPTLRRFVTPEDDDMDSCLPWPIPRGRSMVGMNLDCRFDDFRGSSTGSSTEGIDSETS